MHVDEFLIHYPVLYHLSADGSWPSIEKHGLLSPAAILDKWQITGDQREKLELRQRKSIVVLEHVRHGKISLRDQKVLPESKLRQCLAGCSPADWYRLINGKVFMWATLDRVNRLLSARAYKKMSQILVLVDSQTLLDSYGHKTTLCHRNSGQTRFPQANSLHYGILKSIEDYPTTKDGRPKPEVAEVTVDHSIPDFSEFVLEVQRIVDSSCAQVLFP